ncbi:hypothetical protein llap_15471 [Limosa lapponica baueri]|uniref:Serine-threonine/tyrosine-protein kinase catalytic domain-containing protein n=1 Tax=Limosa lapponica baueri TaxID=1758121 RepID=A0A2I0TK76_LIMLA|nr:hypothetical protein llap_15471 [Limosa lapponica baueri]
MKTKIVQLEMEMMSGFNFQPLATLSSILGQNFISFPRHEEEHLQRTVSWHPCLLILGQNCNAKCQLLNILLGEKLLPTTKISNEENCKRRRIRFTHGTQTRISLALPEQYELVHMMAAHRGHWDTIPEEDLEIHGDNEDPAHRIAELEVMLPYSLLKEVDVVVAPCRGFQSAEATLGEYVNQVLPVVIFAISEAELSASDENELREIKEKFSLPIFFFKVPESGADLISPKKTGNEKSSLYCQLMDLEYLSTNHCSCGAPGPDADAQSMLVEQFEKLRLLSTFSRQVLQKHLVEAATSLNEVHCRCLNIFINQAFDMQRDLQITPKRLEYTRKKENELYESLMNIANRKQEEMKDMIVETLSNMKEELLEDAANMEFKDIIIPENGEPVSSKDIKCCIKQIQELIISRLNQAVANKLISSVDYLRESFVGTLERCLKSLEESWEVSVHPARSLEKSKDVSVHITSNYLKQILNAAYHVEVTFHSGSTVTRMLWEQIKQVRASLSIISSTCHRTLEDGHSGRLEKTEDLWLKVRKDHAPRLARLSLESRSLQDVLLHGKPKLGRELGRGQYGVVYLCDSWGGHFPCALKSVVPPDEKHWNDLALEFHYMRLDLGLRGKYDNSVDVYAFGILFWYICSGHVKLPEAFERCASKDHLWNNVRRGVRPERLPVFDEECWQLMEACWDGDSSQRPLLGIVQPMLQGIMDRLCKLSSEHPNKGLDDST